MQKLERFIKSIETQNERVEYLFDQINYKEVTSITSKLAVYLLNNSLSERKTGSNRVYWDPKGVGLYLEVWIECPATALLESYLQWVEVVDDIPLEGLSFSPQIYRV